MKKTSTVKAFAWSFLEQAGSKVVSVVVQIVLARLLAPEAFGVLAILLVVTNVADAIAQSGLGMSLIQKKDSDSCSFSTAFWLSLAVSIVLYVAIVFSADALAAFYAMPDLAVYLRVLGIVVVFNSMNSIQRAYLQKQFNFKALFRINILAAIASGVLGVLVALLDGGVWALVMQVTSYSVFVFVIMMFLIDWKPSRVFDIAEAKILFSYGWKICATSLLNVVHTGISELVIGKTCSAAELGYYSQGRKYPMTAINVAINALQNVMFPALAAVQDNSDQFRRTLVKMVSFGTYIVFPLTFLFAVIAEPTIRLLLTDVWVPCVPIFQMVCISHCAMIFTLVNLRAYMALGKSGLYLKLQIAKTIIAGLAICLTAILTRDIYLTAFATFVTTLLNALIVDLFPAKRTHGYGAISQIADQWPVYFLTMISSGASYAASFVALPDLVLILVQVSIFAAVYLLGSKMMKLPSFSECKKTIAGIIHKGGMK